MQQSKHYTHARNKFDTRNDMQSTRVVFCLSFQSSRHPRVILPLLFLLRPGKPFFITRSRNSNKFQTSSCDIATRILAATRQSILHHTLSHFKHGRLPLDLGQKEYHVMAIPKSYSHFLIRLTLPASTDTCVEIGPQNTFSAKFHPTCGLGTIVHPKPSPASFEVPMRTHLSF